MMPMKGDGCTYRPKAGETALISGPHFDNENGYTYTQMEVLWTDALFCIARTPGYWPCVWKWDHIRSKPATEEPAGDPA